MKTYNPQGDPIALRHLHNELGLAGRIRHPNIIGPGTVTKLDGDRVEIEMDHADGGSLASYVKRAKYASRDASALPEAEAAALFVGIVDAPLLFGGGDSGINMPLQRVSLNFGGGYGGGCFGNNAAKHQLKQIAVLL